MWGDRTAHDARDAARTPAIPARRNRSRGGGRPPPIGEDGRRCCRPVFHYSVVPNSVKTTTRPARTANRRRQTPLSSPRE